MQTFDMFMVEKWPLLQAFALEGIGRGSFFTVKFKVGEPKLRPRPRPCPRVWSHVCPLSSQLMDMSEKLWQVYSRLDPVSLNRVITEVRSGPPEQLANAGGGRSSCCGALLRSQSLLLRVP